MEIKDLEKKAAFIRLKALMAIQKSGLPVTGASMTSVEILTSLYYGDLYRKPVMNFDPAKPGWEGQDYFVLSKGSSTAVLYAILADLGFFDEAELDYLGQLNSLLQARPVAKVPGVSASVLTDGHGLSIALGIALSLKMERLNNHVFCLLDLAEVQNGQVWEAAMAAAHYKLNNLVLFVDDSGFQNTGTVKSVVDTGYVQAKFDSFGWQVYQVPNGHDFDHLLDALYKANTAVRKPVCVWCHTVSGKGIDFAERRHGYFNAPLSEPELSEIIPKLSQLL
jgi:transketolase